jgi:thiosulfate/3-mercaptopyruvate sulfurtransferase
MSASQPPYTTLISVAQLQALHTSGAPLMVFDCSFDLMQPAAGRALFEETHIAGAVFADLNDDLSTHSPQFSGRAVTSPTGWARSVFIMACRPWSTTATA